MNFRLVESLEKYNACEESVSCAQARIFEFVRPPSDPHGPSPIRERIPAESSLKLGPPELYSFKKRSTFFRMKNASFNTIQRANSTPLRTCGKLNWKMRLNWIELCIFCISLENDIWWKTKQNLLHECNFDIEACSSAAGPACEHPAAMDVPSGWKATRLTALPTRFTRTSRKQSHAHCNKWGFPVPDRFSKR